MGRISEEVKSSYLNFESHIQFFEYINEKFFNNELKIEVKNDGYNDNAFINERYNCLVLDEDIEYLDNLYELINIKHKIERIYDIN